MWRDFAGVWKQFSNTENLKMLAAGDFGQNVVGSTNVGALPLLSKIGKVTTLFVKTFWESILTNFKERIFLQSSCFKAGLSWWKRGKVDWIDLSSDTFLRIFASEWFWFYSVEYLICTLRLVPQNEAFKYNWFIFFPSLAQRGGERRGWWSWRKNSVKWWRSRWTFFFNLMMDLFVTNDGGAGEHFSSILWWIFL